VNGLAVAATYDPPGFASTKYLRVYLLCLGLISSEAPFRTMAKFCTQTCRPTDQTWHFCNKNTECRPTVHL